MSFSVRVSAASRSPNTGEKAAPPRSRLHLVATKTWTVTRGGTDASARGPNLGAPATAEGAPTGNEHRHAPPVVGVLGVCGHQVALLQDHRDQDVDRRS